MRVHFLANRVGAETSLRVVWIVAPRSACCSLAGLAGGRGQMGGIGGGARTTGGRMGCNGLRRLFRRAQPGRAAPSASHAGYRKPRVTGLCSDNPSPANHFWIVDTPPSPLGGCATGASYRYGRARQQGNPAGFVVDGPGVNYGAEALASFVLVAV
jgi:hypothetical protein